MDSNNNTVMQKGQDKDCERNSGPTGKTRDADEE